MQTRCQVDRQAQVLDLDRKVLACARCGQDGFVLPAGDYDLTLAAGAAGVGASLDRFALGLAKVVQLRRAAMRHTQKALR